MAEQSSAEARLEKIKAGFKGGTFWGPIATVGALTIVDGFPPEKEKFLSTAVVGGGAKTPSGAGWNSDRKRS
jgi:hypothetical protein